MLRVRPVAEGSGPTIWGPSCWWAAQKPAGVTPGPSFTAESPPLSTVAISNLLTCSACSGNTGAVLSPDIPALSDNACHVAA